MVACRKHPAAGVHKRFDCGHFGGRQVSRAIGSLPVGAEHPHDVEVAQVDNRGITRDGGGCQGHVVNVGRRIAIAVRLGDSHAGVVEDLDQPHEGEVCSSAARGAEAIEAVKQDQNVGHWGNRLAEDRNLNSVAPADGRGCDSDHSPL